MKRKSKHRLQIHLIYKKRSEYTMYITYNLKSRDK